MAGDVSFDVVSDFDRQELVNALDQVRREIATRYDFKGAKADIELGKEEITLRDRLGVCGPQAIRDLIESKAIRRGLSLKIFDWGAVEPAGGSTVRQKHRPAARPARRPRQEDQQAHPRRVPQGQVADPGRRGAGQRQEQGRAAARHRPPARGGGGLPGAAPVPELPLNTQGRAARIVMILIILALAFSFVIGAVTMPHYVRA